MPKDLLQHEPPSNVTRQPDGQLPPSISDDELFRFMVESVQDYAIFAIDSAGRVMSWNTGAKSLFGYTEAEIIGQAAAIIFTPEDIERGVPEQELRIVGQAGRAEHVRWHVRQDGSQFWAHAIVTPLRDEGGNWRGFLKVVRDQTEQNRAEEAQHRREQESADFFENAVVGLNWVGPDGIILRVNQAELDLLGYTSDEYIGHHISEFHVDREAIDDILKRLMRNETLHNYEARLRCKDGSIRHVLISSNVMFEAEKFIHTRCFTRDITERKLLDIALQESEAQFRAVAETAADAIITIDEQSTILFVNPTTEKIFGYRQQELLGQQLTMLMPEYLRHLHQAGIGRYVETGQKHIGWAAVVLPGLHQDGHEIPLEISFGEFTNAGKRHFTGIARDITERKRAEARDRFLIQLDDTVRSLIDPGEIVATSARLLGEHLGADRCAYAQVEADEDHFVITGDYTNGVASILGRFSMSQFGAEARRLMRANEPYVVADVEEDERLLEEDRDSYRRTQIRAVVSMPLHKGGRFVAGMAVHQTWARRWSPAEVELVRIVANRCWESMERARAARELRASEAKLRMLTNTVPALVWVCASDGEAYDFNDRWFEYTGLTPEQSVGVGWGKAIHPDDVERSLAAWDEARRRATPYEVEVRYRRADGAYRWFLARALPVRDATGRVGAWFGMSIDIEDKKRAEGEREYLLARERAARAEAEAASRLKDEFLATVSHELRTPLTAILGWAHLLRGGHLEKETTVKALETIERNARSQAQLIDDLLDVSRIITGKLRLDARPVEPSPLIEAAIEAILPAAEAKGVRLQKMMDTGAGLISGDPARLQQVIWNLLSNAVKFTPPGGRVLVRLERINSHLEITVSDTGVGISEIFLPFVFERFSQADGKITRQHGGLGIGLAIVRHLVELHGGAVQVESLGEGQGATFRVQLPLITTNETERRAEQVHPAVWQADPSSACPERLDNLKVLIVDDEADTREMLRVVLMQCGAEVLTAASAGEAFALLEQARPDILVSDIGMPDEDGYELIRKVRALPPSLGGRVPAVALTAYVRAEDRLQALRAGYQMHIAKPVEVAELVAGVASLAGWSGNV